MFILFLLIHYTLFQAIPFFLQFLALKQMSHKDKVGSRYKYQLQ